VYDGVYQRFGFAGWECAIRVCEMRDELLEVYRKLSEHASYFNRDVWEFREGFGVWTEGLALLKALTGLVKLREAVACR
jgi:hypothetical protein